VYKKRFEGVSEVIREKKCKENDQPNKGAGKAKVLKD